jgi:two-component system chemotaxis sensor kinase CheA
MIVPAAAVVETIRPAPPDFIDIGHGQRLLNVRGTHVPIIEVASVLGFGAGVDPAQAIAVLVRTGEDTQAALVIGGISDKRQVVIKSLRGNVGFVPGISAATILGDGKVALILDPDNLVGMAARHHRELTSITSFEARHEHAN